MTRRTALAVLLVTFGHAAVSFVLFMVSLGNSLARLDMRNATEAAATTGDRVLQLVVEILLWPLFVPLAQWGGRGVNAAFPGLLGYVPFILNSLIWALAIVYAWRWLRRGRAASR